MQVLTCIPHFFAEMGGFEPPIPCEYAGFRNRCIQPLCHISIFTKYYHKDKYLRYLTKIIFKFILQAETSLKKHLNPKSHDESKFLP